MQGHRSMALGVCVLWLRSNEEKGHHHLGIRVPFWHMSMVNYNPEEAHSELLH
jgi:hypothetical protein